jgi:hypothetical protein
VRLTQLLSLVLTDSASERVRKNHAQAIKELQAEVRRLDGLPRRFPLVFGALTLNATSARYLLPASLTDDAQISTGEQSVVMAFPGVLQSLTIRQANTNGNGEDVIYTVQINGTDTPLTATLATGAIGDVTAFKSRAYEAGDRVAVLCTPQGSGIGAGVNIQVTASVEVAI